MTQFLGFIRAFPRNAEILPADMAVSGEGTVDRTAQLELIDDGGRPEIEHGAQRLGELIVRTMPVPSVSTSTETGWATPIA